MRVKISEYAKTMNVTYRTVWNWSKSGHVKIEKSKSGLNYVILDDILSQKVAIYCRVSSSENKSNLESQKNRLIDYCNAKGYQVSQVITEIGSGLNDERKKLESLLLDRSITIIVVEHKDRLARFGINYISKLLGLDGRKIEVVNNVNGDENELMQDFVSIITSFVARLYGRRRSKRNTEKLITDLKNS
jgi:predicted site-specific integrase-resolvase